MGHGKGERRKEKDHAEYTSVYVYTHLTYLSINIGERRKEKLPCGTSRRQLLSHFSFLISDF
jgi:hypothetical protein